MKTLIHIYFWVKALKLIKLYYAKNSECRFNSANPVTLKRIGLLNIFKNNLFISKHAETQNNCNIWLNYDFLYKFQKQY